MLASMKKMDDCGTGRLATSKAQESTCLTQIFVGILVETTSSIERTRDREERVGQGNEGHQNRQRNTHQHSIDEQRREVFGNCNQDREPEEEDNNIRCKVDKHKGAINTSDAMSQKKIKIEDTYHCQLGNIAEMKWRY